MTDKTVQDGGDKAPVPGSPEYDAKMAAIARDARNNSDNPLDALAKQADDLENAQKPQRPENVPEKFWDAEKGEVNTEALLKSYTELESGREKKVEEEVEKTPEEAAADEQIATAVKAAGLDPKALQSKILNDGDLEDSDYAALEKIGFDREFVEGIVELQVFARNQAVEEAIEYFGGDQAKDELFDWAARNLPEEKVAEYNELLAGPHWRVAADALKADRAGRAKTAGEPSLRAGNGNGGGPVAGYQSRDEMRADMADPQYHDRGPKGDAFRAQVYQKAKLAAWNRK